MYQIGDSYSSRLVSTMLHSSLKFYFRLSVVGFSLNYDSVAERTEFKFLL